MSGGYSEVLRTRGALRVFLPALAGRMSFAMVTLSLLYSVQSSTHSFAAAGAATGAFGFANVIGSPHRARIVDRLGQRRALNVLAASYSAGLLILAMLTAARGTPAWTLVTVSALVGALPPPLGAAMRVVWSALTPVGLLRTRAYSIDAVSEELLFTTGPLITATIISAASPPAGLLVTAVVALLGTLGMTSSTTSKSIKPAKAPPHKTNRPLAQPGFVAVLVALFGIGIVLGTVELAAPAVASQQGSIDLAGILLAAFAAGSALGGLLYGRRAWKIALVSRLIISGALMTLLSTLLVFAPTVTVLGIGLAAVGFFLAPSLVTGYLLADDITAPEVRTEASTWINAAVNAGAAAASAGVGVIVDSFTPHTGFLVGATTAFVVIAVASPHLVRRRQPPVITPSEKER